MIFVLRDVLFTADDVKLVYFPINLLSSSLSSSSLTSSSGL